MQASEGLLNRLHSANWRSLVQETAHSTVHPSESTLQRLCHSHQITLAHNKTK